MNAIKTAGIIGGVGLNTDKSARFRVTTPEVDDACWKTLKDLSGINVVVVISPTDIPETGLVEVKGEGKKRTQSQRLRDVLHVLWEHIGSDTPFEDYYIKRTSQMIDRIKAEIDGYE